MGKSNNKKNIRYEILKRKFPYHFILLTTPKTRLGLRSFGVDKIIFDYIRENNGKKRKDLYNYLKKNQINYIILNNFNEPLFKEFEENNYETIYHRAVLCNLLDEVYDASLDDT